MLEAIFVPIVGAVVSTFLQEAVSKIKNKKVTRSAASIQKIISDVNDKIRKYEAKFKDRSEHWREKIAELRRSWCNLEDCIDEFKKKKLTVDAFGEELAKIETALTKKSAKIYDYIEAQDKALKNRGSNQAHQVSLQGQHDVPNHAISDLVGIEEAKKDLLALVGNYEKQLEGKGNTKVTKVISIVGFGGVGKTCLAAQVYRDSKVVESFPLGAFVRATGMHIEGVLQEVQRQIQDPRASLRSDNKRCLIVVDGVQDAELGSRVISGFREVTTSDGIIIMTTTVQKLAETWSCNNGHVYKMTPLSVGLSGKLLLQTLLKDGGDFPDVDVPKSEEAGKECDGVPLAVITWAQYWKDDPGKCATVWSKFGDPYLRHRLREMELVLEQSYGSLPSFDLQTCLLYFSLFRRDHPIRRGSLIRRWLAEGAEVGCDNLSNNHIAALQNWETLLDRNVIQESINKDRGAKTCRPSGAMLGYITHMSRPEGFATQCSDEVCTDQGIRRLSLQTRRAEVLEDAKSVSRLRTLVVSPENNNEIKAANLSLDKCDLLRVLDLEACSGQVKIEELCKKLTLLKYLSLPSASIDYVPQEITRLECLETLDVGKDRVVVVHIDVCLMPKLKHLIGKFKLRKSMGLFFNKKKFQAKCLQTLAGFVTLGGNGFPQLMKHMYMIHLRKVKVFFDPEASAESLSSRLADAITAFLIGSAVSQLSLSIDSRECKQTSDVLRSLENAKGGLYSLKLCGTSNLPAFGSFIGNLNGIEKLCISFDTLSWQVIMDAQKYLPELKYLKLVAKDSFIGVSEQPIAGQATATNVLLINGDQFNKLKGMWLQSKQILPKIEIRGEALTKLDSLHLISEGIGHPTAVICNSNSAKQIPPVQNQNRVADRIPPLKNLKEVTLQSSSPVDDDIKKAWHQAARGHPKCPQVLFIDMHEPHKKANPAVP